MRPFCSARDCMHEVEILCQAKVLHLGYYKSTWCLQVERKGLASVVQAIHDRLPGISTKRDLYMQSLMQLLTTGEGCGYGYGGDVRGMRNEMCC